jgi:aryl-alcohol dehydrogenase-like predicted oxidoreductase
MQRRVLGKTGLSVSPLGFGGAEIGFAGADQAVVSRLLNGALDAGLNVIDTAECYRNSEELIGKAVSNRRDDFHLFTKCGHNLGFDLPDWEPRLLEQSIDRSLKLLNTDRLDLVQLHSCSEEQLRQGDVIDVLQRARDAGKTRFIGYSGDRNHARYAVECGAFDTLQISVNIADQEPIDEIIPAAKAQGMGVIAKRPVANVAWTKSDLPDNDYSRPYWDRLSVLGYPFLSLPDAASFALRFTLSIPGVDTAIVGTTRPERWQENARYLERGPLPDDEFQAIRDRWLAAAQPDWVGQT